MTGFTIRITVGGVTDFSLKMRLSLRAPLFMLALSMMGGCRPGNVPPSAESGVAVVGSRSVASADSASVRARARDFQFQPATLVPGDTAIYRNLEEEGQFSILESLGGGIASLDFDRDGDLDLLLPGGGGIDRQRVLSGRSSYLLRQTAGQQFVDCSTAAGPLTAEYCTHAVVAGDFNADGFEDVVITGYRGQGLWQNQGDGTWLEVSNGSGLQAGSWNSSAAWGDFNGDHLLDLFLATYTDWSTDNDPVCHGRRQSAAREVCAPHEFRGQDDLLFLSRGDGRFELAGMDFGLKSAGKGLGAISGDFDGDGWIDLYITNDTDENFYYANTGGRLSEQGVVSGTAGDDRGNPNGSMGVTVLDFDRDQQPDLFVANFEDEWFAMYRAVGPHEYLYASSQCGLSALGRLLVGFGVTAADLDLDGDEDLTVTNGHVVQVPENAPRMQLPLVLSNEGGRRLVRWPVPEGSYFDTPAMGRGLLSPDLDHDGRPDLVFSHINAPPAVLLNRLATNGRGFTVRLVGRIGPRDAEGAVVRLESKAGTQLRLVTSGGSYLSGGEPSVHFGLAEGDEPLRLRIQWPGGRQQTVELAGMASPLFSADGGDRARVATADSQPDGEAQSPVAIVVVPHHLLVREPPVP